MDPALDSHCDLGGMYTYSPASKCSSALPHQPSRPPRHDQYEICGLTRTFDPNSSPSLRRNKYNMRVKSFPCRLISQR